MTHEFPIHLWRLTGPDDAVARMAAHLSEDEAARAARFVFDRDRRAYILGRGRLREILGAEMGRAPAAVRFGYGAHGKPFVTGGPWFNLSHSDGIACLSLHPSMDFGLDIEAFRQIEDGVAERFFSATEYASLSALPSDQWTAGFFRCWTRKEAVVKAMGDGLSIPLDAFDVTLRPGDAPLMTRLDPALGQAADWQLAHFELGPDMVGALAVRAPGEVTLRCVDCPPGLHFHAPA
ncbi:4'-phosphopantetheinyl transferase superfamily protein [Oceanicola sp. 22II-s10i]|uniref:4'-phosphopantetheinyl transferase family protein n=1 Tax=Oceanicola sp. 22II-s10i TaxID=1317116 RepID=UPI000B5233AA|nr:4'-phosphopantetheinyl transferase superfamily protein [Oceanicola sp. 22II-s10i]